MISKANDPQLLIIETSNHGQKLEALLKFCWKWLSQSLWQHINSEFRITKIETNSVLQI